MRTFARFIAVVVCALFVAIGPLQASEAREIRRAGKGALYEVEGQRLAILAGTPEEMGA